MDDHLPHSCNTLVHEIDMAGAVDEIHQERLSSSAFQDERDWARLHREPPLLFIHTSVRVPHLLLGIERLYPAVGDTTRHDEGKGLVGSLTEEVQ